LAGRSCGLRGRTCHTIHDALWLIPLGHLAPSRFSALGIVARVPNGSPIMTSPLGLTQGDAGLVRIGVNGVGIDADFYNQAAVRRRNESRLEPYRQKYQGAVRRQKR
jgi:hypothetical protein